MDVCNKPLFTDAMKFGIEDNKFHDLDESMVTVNQKGDKFWCKNGVLHKEDGPAIIYKNGNQYWYKNGVLHNENGPAIVLVSGAVYFYRNGIRCNNHGNMIICR